MRDKTALNGDIFKQNNSFSQHSNYTHLSIQVNYTLFSRKLP